MIIDSHAHVFPWLGGESGYGDAKLHKLYVQKGMVGHSHSYRRRDTREIASERDMLWDLEKPGLGGYREVGLDLPSFGRVTWKKDGVDYYLQFMPPSLQTNEAPPELLIAMMDHAGVDVAVLQNDHLYGDLNEYFASAIKAYPDRLIGLIQVDETIADHDDQIAKLHDGVKSGLRGLFYATFAFFRTEFADSFDAPKFHRFWSDVQTLKLPVFWDLDPIPDGTREDYLRELKKFATWSERYPGIPCLFVQAMPLRLFWTDGRLELPPLLAGLAAERGILIELALPITYGRQFDYPYSELTSVVETFYDAVGSSRLAWGSDVPNVERHCTYRQSLEYLSRTCSFFKTDDLRLILGENLRRFLSITDKK